MFRKKKKRLKEKSCHNFIITTAYQKESINIMQQYSTDDNLSLSYKDQLAVKADS